MNRFKAATIHLSISLGIALLTFLWLKLVWYPEALFTLMDGLALLIILLGVDVVMGPLITLVIFDTRKKNLKWDLLCVAFLQTAALIYGLYAMWQARPVWLAYTQGEFQVVAVPDIAGEPGMAEYEALRTLPAWGPKWIGIAASQKLMGEFEVAVGLQAGGKISAFPKAWQPYKKVTNEILASAKPLHTLKEHEDGQKVLKGLNHYIHLSKPPLWLPLTSSAGRKGIVLINAQTAAPIETIAF